MPQPSLLYTWGPGALALLFFLAVGATVGSFINVIVYRLPRGQGIIRPASACPACGTRLRWTENFPVLGWLWLRGRCRFCKTPISPEYPLVELTLGLLFSSLYALWFMRPSALAFLGDAALAGRPEWTAEGLTSMWPTFALVLTLIASLAAMTLIDARTFTIPLLLPWIVGAAGLLIHPLHAAWVSLTAGGLARSPFAWTIWTPGSWAPLAAGLGGAIGLAISTWLVHTGLLPRSFADFEQWEAEQSSGAGVPPVHGRDARATDASPSTGEASAPTNEDHHAEQDISFGPILLRTLLFTGPGVAGMLLGFAIGEPRSAPFRGMFLGMAMGLALGLVLRRLIPVSDDQAEPAWVQYPHARREMGWELAFLAPALALGALGWLVFTGVGGEPPLWLRALGGSLLGLLTGGGIVWATRILGTLAFGKEAMGLGDVHLMAAVGAVLGPIDPVLAFFVAPFFGIAWTLLGLVITSLTRREGTALPYGPHLAAATLLVIYAKPLFEAGLTRLLNQPVNLP